MKKKSKQEKSKRLNFNAAISLALRGVCLPSYGWACPCLCLGTQHSMNLTVRWTHDKRAAWWLMSHHSAYSIEFLCYYLLLFSFFLLPRLKPFYKCLQCCVICNWIRVQWQHEATVLRQDTKRYKCGTHGLTEKFRLSNDWSLVTSAWEEVYRKYDVYIEVEAIFGKYANNSGENVNKRTEKRRKMVGCRVQQRLRRNT